MLSLRPACENCNCALPANSTEAMICSFECTFCLSCVTDILSNVCPNFGGGFEKRPVRPVEALARYPASSAIIHKPIDLANHQRLLSRYENILPDQR